MSRFETIVFRKIELMIILVVIILGGVFGLTFNYAFVRFNLDISFSLIPISILAIIIFLLLSKRANVIERLGFGLLIISLSYMVDYNVISTPEYRGTSRGLAISSTDFLIFFLFAILLIRFLSKRDFKLNVLPKLTLPILFLLGVNLLSLINAPNLTYGLFEIFKLVKGLLLFWLTANLVKREDDLEFCGFLLSSAILVQVGFGMRQHFFGRYRLGGTIGHPNSLSMFLVMLLPLVFTLTFAEIKPTLRLLTGFTFISGTGLQILTFSRTGWVAFGFSMVIVVTLLTIRKKLNFKHLLQFLLVAVFLGIIFYHYSGRIIGRWQDPTFESSKEGRIAMIETALIMLREHPLTGVGINNYVYSIPYFISEELLPRGDWAPVHNIYFLTLAETGILGFIAFIFLLGKIVSLTLKCSKSNSPLVAYISLGLFGSYSACFLQGLAEWILKQDQIYTIFWFLTGLVAAIYKMERERQDAQSFHNNAVKKR